MRHREGGVLSRPPLLVAVVVLRVRGASNDGGGTNLLLLPHPVNLNGSSVTLIMVRITVRITVTNRQIA